MTPPEYTTIAAELHRRVCRRMHGRVTVSINVHDHTMTAAWYSEDGDCWEDVAATMAERPRKGHVMAGGDHEH